MAAAGPEWPRCDRSRRRGPSMDIRSLPRDDGRAERTIRDRSIVRDRRHAYGVEVGNAEADQDRRHEGPRIAEADKSLEQRAERPGEQHGLDADTLGALRDEPTAQLFERSGHYKRVEEHHAPEGD